MAKRVLGVFTPNFSAPSHHLHSISTPLHHLHSRKILELSTCLATSTDLASETGNLVVKNLLYPCDWDPCVSLPLFLTFPPLYAFSTADSPSFFSWQNRHIAPPTLLKGLFLSLNNQKSQFGPSTIVSGHLLSLILYGMPHHVIGTPTRESIVQAYCIQSICKEV